MTKINIKILTLYTLQDLMTPRISPSRRVSSSGPYEFISVTPSFTIELPDIICKCIQILLSVIILNNII